MAIEMGKQYRTRDGREVRIYAVDGGGEYPVHGASSCDGEHWLCGYWTVQGVSGIATARDLVEIPLEPTYRPFTAAELPRIVGRRVRPKEDSTDLLTVMLTYADGRYVGNDCYKMTNDDICSHWQFLDYDADGNEIVTPCGVRVES